MINTTIRTKVLEYSLQIEHFVSDELSRLIDIKDFKNSKSLGNKTTSLSLNQKLNLLLDCETITKKEKSIIESFTSIRNQFMHNIDSNTYEFAVNQIDGLLNRLKKLYPKNFEDNNLEKNIEKCIDSLYIDALRILSSVKGNKLKKRLRDYFANSDGIFYEALKGSLEKHIAELEEFIENNEEDNIPKQEILKEVIVMDLKILKDLTDAMIVEDRKYKEIIG